MQMPKTLIDWIFAEFDIAIMYVSFQADTPLLSFALTLAIMVENRLLSIG